MKTPKKDNLLKIADLVKQSGLTERMLRHYEQLGILEPTRSLGGTRYYSPIDLDIARLIRLFRELDIPLETMAAIALERRQHLTGDESSSAVGELLDSLAHHLEEKAQKSLALQQTIVAASKAVKTCRGCQNKPTPATCPECPLNSMVDSNAMTAMIWR